MQKVVNDTHNKKISCNNMCGFRLVYYSIKVDWPMIVNVQCLKEAKTKPTAIKIHFQIVRKWGSCNIILLFRLPSI